MVGGLGEARLQAEVLAELHRAFLAHVVGEDGVDVPELHAGLVQRLERGDGAHGELVVVGYLAQRGLGHAGDVDVRQTHQFAQETRASPPRRPTHWPAVVFML